MRLRLEDFFPEGEEPPSREEAINKTIARLETLDPEQAVMSQWLVCRDCKTVGCIAGWAYASNLPATVRQGTLANIEAEAIGRLLFRLSENEAKRLFVMWNEPAMAVIKDGYMRFFIGSVEDFDELPAEFRRDAMVEVLKILRDDQKISWPEAIQNVCRRNEWDFRIYPDHAIPARDPEFRDPGFWNTVTAGAVLIVSLLFMLSLCHRAEAHSWYPWACCSGNDCAEIESWVNQPDGSVVVRTRHGVFALSREWIAQNSQPSQDFDSHLCVKCTERQLGKCVSYVPRDKCMFLGGGV